MHTTIGVNFKDRTTNRRTSRELRQAFKDDKRFFRRHPLRRHRVRLAVPGEGPEPFPGERMYAVVRKIAEGVHMKCYFALASDSELPVSPDQMDEDDCAAAFRTYQPPSSETLVTAITDMTWREALARAIPQGSA